MIDHSTAELGDLIDSAMLAMVAAATDRATVGRLLRVFVEDTGRRLDRLDGLAAAGARAALAHEAHALKGSAASMGAASIAALAGEIEHRAARSSGDLVSSVAALRLVAERSYPLLLGWAESKE